MQSQHRPRKRRKFGKRQIAFWGIVLFLIGYQGFSYYYKLQKPYLVAIDAGHGGEDVGAVGIIEEVELTETTAQALYTLLKEDGRFRILQTRQAGEPMSITERNHVLTKSQPDLLLSIHGNADETGKGTGFECYPSVPSMENHEKSMQFATCLANEMEKVGATLRGENGIRFGYYIPQSDGSTQKWLVDASNASIYEYDTFGILYGLDDAPTVLVEQCFITNEKDVASFGTQEGCQKAAQAYYQAILEYFGL